MTSKVINGYISSLLCLKSNFILLNHFDNDNIMNYETLTYVLQENFYYYFYYDTKSLDFKVHLLTF